MNYYHAFFLIAGFLLTNTVFANNTPSVFLQPDHDGSVGATGGEHSVGTDGSANYTIPINTPAGLGGVQPSLSLTYSSNGGDGSTGVGWSLDGLSSISRCASNPARGEKRQAVTYTPADHLCMDGQRLVIQTDNSVSKTYKTEVDSFARINSDFDNGNGPGVIYVETKDGKKLEYGSSDESKLIAKGGSAIVEWGLSKIVDKFGNELTVEYETLPALGAYRPVKINYSANTDAGVDAKYSVVFEYADNQRVIDNSMQYEAGYSSEKNWHLTAVKIYTGQTLLRTYALEYEYPQLDSMRLVKIQECVGNSCFKPTHIDWGNNITDGFNAPAIQKNISNSHLRNAIRKEFFLDFNGDGLIDYGLAEGKKFYVGLNNANGGFDDLQLWMTLYLGNTDSASSPKFVHINGDDLIDVVWGSVKYPDHYTYVFINQGDSFRGMDFFRRPSSRYKENAFAATSYESLFNSYVDINSDGRTDFIARSLEHHAHGIKLGINHGDRIEWKSGLVLDETSNGAGVLPYSTYGKHSFYLDFNGDGLVDKLWRPHGRDDLWLALNNANNGFKKAVRVLKAPADGGVVLPYSGVAGEVSYFGKAYPFTYKKVNIRADGSSSNLVDVNADGLSDLVWIPYDDNRLWVAINNGVGFEQPKVWMAAHSYHAGETFDTAAEKNTAIMYADIDGNNLPDRIWQPKGKRFLVVAKNLNNGRFESARIISDTQNIKIKANANLADINGDNALDLIWQADGRKDYHIKFGRDYFTAQLKKVTNGMGHVTEFEYKSLTDSSVYKKDQLLESYPLQEWIPTHYVVSQVNTQNGTGFYGSRGWFRTAYFYEGFSENVATGMPLGFSQQITTNLNTDMRTITNFSQDFNAKTVGAVTHIINQARNFFWIPISTTTNIWRTKTDNPGSNETYRQELFSTNTLKLDINTKFLSFEVTDFSYDNYGNVIKLEETLYDTSFFQNGDKLREKTTISTYENNPNPGGLLGLMTSMKTTVKALGRPEISRKTSWEYDYNKGTVLKEHIVDPSNENILMTSSYENIDQFGHALKTVISGPDFTTRSSVLSYDSSGRFVTSATNALGHTSTTSYYPDHHINAGLADIVTDSNGFKTKYFYDDVGRNTRTINYYGTGKPVESYNSFQWCATSSVICPSNAIYLISSSSQGGAGSRVFKDKLGRTVRESSQRLDGRFAHIDYSYDYKGRNYKISEPYFDGDIKYYETAEYDTLGHLVKMTASNGRVDTTVYDGLEQTSYIDVYGKNQSKKEYRDSLNQLIKVLDNAGQEITYQYNSMGDLTQLKDANNNTTKIYYDTLGRKIRMDDPDKGTWKYTYNSLGQLLTQTDAMGLTICTAYDVLGRMVKRIDGYSGSKTNNLGQSSDASNQCAGNYSPLMVSTWEYDTASGKAKGQLAKVQSKAYEDNYYYDNFGRLSENIKRYDNETYSVKNDYDNLHRISQVTYPGSNPANRVKVLNRYNNLGFLTHLASPGSTNYYHQVLAMDARGHITQEKFGNGASTNRSYHPQTGHIQSIQSRDITGGLTIQNLSFNFDVLGNVIERNDHLSAYVESFEYDNLNRLSTTSSNMDNSGNQTTSISYDALGNILSKTGVGSYKYGSQCGGSGAGPHAVCQITAGTIGTKNASYRYNANGDMISGDGRTIQYTAFGKPSEIIQSGRMVKIQYGPDRNRYRRTDTVAGKNTQYTYINGLYEKVVSSTKTEERHFIGANVVLSLTNRSLLNAGRKEIRYLHKDHIGSISAITDGTSLVEERHSFDAWGKRRAPDMQTLVGKLGAWSTLTNFQKGNTTLPAFALSSIVTNKGFTGHEQLDPVGLIHMNGRVYDADIGRFISADPFIEDRSNLQSLNRYTYVRNNPLSYTDPSGYFSFKKKFRKAWRSVRNHAKKGLRSLRGHVKKHLIKVGNVINKVPYLSTAVGIVIAVVASPAAAAIYFKILAALNAAIALANGGEITSLAVGFAVGYITGGVTDAVGSALGGSIAAQYVSGALVGAVTAKAMGGSANDGAIGGALSVGVRHAMGEFKDNKASAKNNSKGSGSFCAVTPHPIDIATGEKYLTMLDYRAAGAGQLSFERYYSSYSEAETSLGRGWRSNFDRKLIFSDITIDDEASSITYEDAKGEHIQFSRSFAGGWNNTSNTLHTLTPHPQGWQLNDGKGNYERFNEHGLLISSYQLGGYEQRLQYNEQQQLIRVIDSFQRQLSFAYNADGLLSQMTDPQGQVTQYHYNDNLVLNKVSKPSHDEGNGQDGFKQYHYDDQRFPYAITGISDELGQRLHTMAYDDHGRAIVSALGGSAERVDIRFHGYDEQGQRQATVKNALGRETTYTFDQDNKPVSISGHATNNCIAANQAYSYDERGNILSKTDWNGNITRFEYNQRNLETLRIEAAGTELERQIRTQWHTDFARPVRIIEPGRTTDMHYNQHGLLLEQTVYDTQSKRSRLQQWLGSYPSRSIRYRYNDQGQLIEVDGPRNDVADITRFAYDAAGNRISITNALGQKTQVLAFDANGRPLRLRDAQGLETELAYNARGWLSHKTVKTQQGDVTTRYEYAHSGDYNGQGQISRISLPNGNQIHYEYDSANRLIALSNRLGERLEYTLDLEGNRIGERTLNPQGELIKARQQLFDELSRLLAVVGSQGQQSRYQYDGQGNLIAHSDGRNHQTRYAFDALNRLISTHDAHQGQIQQSYNAQGLLSQVTDQRGLSTQYQYNGFGDRIARISPDTGRTDYHYNTAGLLISKTDARGIQTQYHYDALGRVIHQHYPAANDEDIYYDYDQLSLNGHQISQPGRLLQVRDASGSRLYQYNELGQITEQQSRIIASRATGSSQQSDTQQNVKQQNAKQQNYHYQAQYNLAGELESERYPGGAQIHYQRDAIGRIQQLSVQASANSAEQSVAKDIDYASFSGLQSLHYGNDLQLERKRDLDGRISHIQLSSDTAQLTNDTAANDALYHGQYDYDLNGNIIAIHEQGGTQHYRYDALNRLISSDNKHHSLSYEYDSVGNRRQRQQNKNQQEAEKGAQEHYHYAEHSNRLLSVRNLFNNTERKLGYDALGNIIRDQRSSKTLSLSYNAANRLEQVDIALNEQERSLGISHKTAYYRYNASGQRVSKWVWQQHESGRQGLDHSASRHFHYNPHQQLIAETDHQGNAIKAYIYAGETRVALLDYRHNPQGELYFIHNDHLGTPKLITNSAQQIVWRNTASAFGQIQTAQADNQASQLEQNLSFPGQYRDAETGFSYNYFRDYDPSLGRYIQSDPIGLEGGVNTYGYVMGNPIGLIDLFGLETTLITTYDFGIGSHTALHVKNKNGVYLYDPAGSYKRTVGGSGRLFEGADANLDKYIAYQKSTGSSVSLQSLNTDIATEKAIINRAEDIGDVMGGFCAGAVSGALGGACNIKGSGRPGKLEDNVKDVIKSARKTEGIQACE